MHVSSSSNRRSSPPLQNYAECDVAIVGAGSAGLACAYELSKVAPHLKVGAAATPSALLVCLRLAASR